MRVVCQASFCSVLLSFSLHVFLFLFLIFHSLCSSLCSPCFFLYLSPSLYWEACESSLSDILDVESGTEKGLPSQCWMSLHHRVLMLQTSLRGPNLKNTNAFRILAFSICSRCCNNFFTQSSFPLHTPSWLYYKLNQEIKQFSIHQVCKICRWAAMWKSRQNRNTAFVFFTKQCDLLSSVAEVLEEGGYCTVPLAITASLSGFLVLLLLCICTVLCYRQRRQASRHFTLNCCPWTYITLFQHRNCE